MIPFLLHGALAGVADALSAHCCDTRGGLLNDVSEVRVRVHCSPLDAPDSGRHVLTATLLRRGSSGGDEPKPEVFYRATVGGPAAPIAVPDNRRLYDALRDDAPRWDDALLDVTIE